MPNLKHGKCYAVQTFLKLPLFIFLHCQCCPLISSLKKTQIPNLTYSSLLKYKLSLYKAKSLQTAFRLQFLQQLLHIAYFPVALCGITEIKFQYGQIKGKDNGTNSKSTATINQPQPDEKLKVAESSAPVAIETPKERPSVEASSVGDSTSG